MSDMEIKRKVRLSREEAGKRLIAIGTALTEGPKSKLEFDEQTIRFGVANELEWEFELELEGDETELEIELKWTDSPPVTKSPPHPRASRRRATRAS